MSLGAILTAVITPMAPDGSIDEAGFVELLGWCAENGSEGFVVCGTTGEAPTLTTDEHLREGDKASEMGKKATSREGAYDLYASRYWALRMMWEGHGEVESPIADPDLAMVAPDRHGPLDAPPLRGLALPPDLLRVLYRDAALALLARV